MGLSSTTNRVSYVGDGSSTVFSFPYEFFSASDLQVYIYDSGSSIIYPQTLNTNYTVSGGQNVNGIYPNGGNVVYASAVPANFQSIIVRAPSPVQNYVLLQNGQINSLALVQQFDYLTALVQRLQDEVSRSITMPDGLGSVNGVNFSSGLPSSINLASSAFQVLTINSGATGWTLSVVPGVGAIIPVVQGGTGQGAPLIPGAIMYAVNSSLINPSAQGSAGQVLLSGGAGSPSWGSVSIGSGAVTAGSIQGILGLYQGGTNTGSSYSYPVSGVIVASGSLAPQQFAGVSPGASGLPFVSTGAGAQPAFQAISLSGAGVSGTLPLSSGGTNTGSGAFFPVSGVVIASAGVQIAAIGGAAVGQVFTSQGSSAPSWQLLNLSNQVQGTLGVLSGGTGQVDATKAFNAFSPTTTQGDIAWFQGSSNVRLPAGAANTVLTMGAGSSVSWASPSTGTTLNVATKTANYNAATTDDVILCNSGAMLINLYGASGNSGKLIRIEKIDSGQGIITVAGSSALINGSSLTLNHQYEYAAMVCDGANWSVVADNRSVSLNYVNASGTVTASFTTVAWKTKLDDSHNAYNIATGTFIAPLSGVYTMDAHTCILGSSAHQSGLRVIKNGTAQLVQMYTPNGPIGVSAQISCDLPLTLTTRLAQNDTLIFQHNDSSQGTNSGVTSDSSRVYMSITRLCD